MMGSNQLEQSKKMIFFHWLLSVFSRIFNIPAKYVYNVTAMRKK